MPIRVILFDDNEDRRRSLRYLLEMTNEIDLVADFSHCRNAVAEVEQSEPDVVLMDIQMPDVNGIEAVKQIKLEHPKLPILMQTVFEDEELIFQAIQAGASGYILKNEKPDRILSAIKEIHEGGAPMSAMIAAKVIGYFRQPAIAANAYRLTDKETEILRLLTEGYSYKIIAAKQGISYHTVNSHIRHIYEKLHVNSLGEAIAKAIRENII